jgi:hypothetical protein
LHRHLTLIEGSVFESHQNMASPVAAHRRLFNTKLRGSARSYNYRPGTTSCPAEGIDLYENANYGPASYQDAPSICTPNRPPYRLYVAGPDRSRSTRQITVFLRLYVEPNPLFFTECAMPLSYCI